MRYNKTITRLLLLAGTFVVSFLPLYLTALKDAIYDGALLILAFAYSADAIFRCVNPSSRRGNLNLAFVIGAVIILLMAALQYGPIANDLRKEKQAIASALDTGSIEPIVAIEGERQSDRESIPNNSIVLLISGIVAEVSVIILVER